MRKAGRGVDFDDAAALLRGGARMFSQTTSMPAMSSPIVLAASTAIAALSGWTSSVTSVAVPPVERLELSRRSTTVPGGGTLSQVRSCLRRVSSAAASILMRVRADAVAVPRRGSSLTILTRSRMLCCPSATTWAGRRSGGGHQLAAHDQQAEIVARKVPLDDDAAWSTPGQSKAVSYLLLGGEVDADAFALVAVVGLDHDRAAEVSGRPPRRRRAARQRAPSGTGTPTLSSSSLVSSLSEAISTPMFGGVRGFGGLDAAGVAAMAQLHKGASLRRNQGMPRACAASTMDWVEGRARCPRRSPVSRPGAR